GERSEARIWSWGGWGAIRESGRAVEVISGAERPVASITGDQHADAAREHAGRHGEGEIAGGEPAVSTGIQNRRRGPFLDADGPPIVNCGSGFAVNYDEA